jgi:hypothetical protein
MLDLSVNNMTSNGGIYTNIFAKQDGESVVEKICFKDLFGECLLMFIPLHRYSVGQLLHGILATTIDV